MERNKSVKQSDGPNWSLSHSINQVFLLAMVFLVSWPLETPGYVMPSRVSWLAMALLGAVVLLMLYGAFKKNVNYVWWEAVLLFMAYGGIWLVSLAIFPTWLAVMVGAALSVLPFFVPVTLASNLSMLFGTVGIGLLAAMHLPTHILLICAGGVAIYEYYRAKGADLATLVSEAWHAGVVPGLLVPADWHGWFKGIGETWQPGKGLVAGLLPFAATAGMGFLTVHFGRWLFLGYVCATLAMAYLIGREKQTVLRWWAFPASATVAFAAIALGAAMV